MLAFVCTEAMTAFCLVLVIVSSCNTQSLYLPKLCIFLFNNHTGCPSPSFIKKDVFCLGYEESSSTFDRPVLESSNGTTVQKKEENANGSVVTLSEEKGCDKESRHARLDRFHLGRPTPGHFSTIDLQLHQACEEWKLDIVQNILIHEKADINCRGLWGRTPIMSAAFKGQLSVFEFLLSQGSNMSAVDDNQDTLLHVACMGGNVIIVRKLIDSGMYDTDKGDENSATPIMEAVYCGHCELFDFLAHRGCDVKAVNAQRQNILHIACMGGHADMVKHILLHKINGLSVGSKDLYGSTPLMLAVEMNCVGIFRLFVFYGCSLTDVKVIMKNTLFLASSYCHGCLEYILSQTDIDTETKSKSGWTPVMYAVRFLNKETFNFLVSKGCSLKVTDMYKNNILHLAAMACNADVANYILNKGILDIDSRNNGMMTPIMLSACTGVFDVFMNNGSNLKVVDKEGNNILHVACRTGWNPIVKYVLSLDIFDIESRGVLGRTPVMLAVCSNCQRVVHLLMQASCNMKAVDDHGDTVLHLACKYAKARVLGYLLRLEVVRSLKMVKNNYGRTPLQEAQHKRHKEIVSLLGPGTAPPSHLKLS